MARALEIDPDDRMALYNAACTWSQIGEPDRALDYLERWAKVAAPETREWLKQDPDMNPLRDEQRYKELVRLIDSEAEAQAAQRVVAAPVTGAD